MPKERFHMLLTEQSLKLSGFLPGEGSEERSAVLLGSVLPDIFFYDLPNFRWSATGVSLHRYQGEEGFRLCASWLKAKPSLKYTTIFYCLLGVASHLLADGFWHPSINRESFSGSEPCRKYRLPPQSCHHWLEGQLEALWIPLLAPPETYRSRLKAFREGAPPVPACLEFYSDFLSFAGFRPVPSVPRMRRCLFWQTTLLRAFTDPRFTRWQERLLTGRPAKRLGALLVPPPGRGIEVAGGRTAAASEGRDLATGSFLASSVIYLSERLRELF